jgi:UDP-glucose:(heptosyl)LPS alpha-1,3-glucosyltransferase
MVESEREKFRRYYQTPLERFHVLPAGIPRDRMRPPDAAEIRQRMRKELAIGPQDYVALMVGSDFKRKGLERAIRALAALPEALRQRAWLMVAGRGHERPYRRLAARLGVESRLQMLGPRQDVPQLLWSADLLVHPAYREAAGMALLEGLAAGLPVLTTDNCGYAFHVQRAEAGLVVPSPFSQARFDQALAEMVGGSHQTQWQRNALAYLERTDLFGLPEKTADLIEHLVDRARASRSNLSPFNA